MLAILKMESKLSFMRFIHRKIWVQKQGGVHMKKKKRLLILGVIAGPLLNFIAMMWGTELGGNMRNMSGVLLMVGCFLFSICLNRLSRLSYEKEFPDLVREEEIEYQDERNTQIRNRAKAKSADIIQWVILFTAGLVFVIPDCPWWLVAVLLGIYFLRSGIEWYYTEKYRKEM